MLHEPLEPLPASWFRKCLCLILNLNFVVAVLKTVVSRLGQHLGLPALWMLMMVPCFCTCISLLQSNDGFTTRLLACLHDDVVMG